MRPTHSERIQGSRSVISRASALLLALVGLVVLGLTPDAAAASGFLSLEPQSSGDVVTVPGSFTFEMVRSAGVTACLPNARAAVQLTSRGENQVMDVAVTGLPPGTALTLFVLQLPHAPFGLSWYQGDVVTDAFGNGHAKFVGIFSDETFVVAPGVGASPALHAGDAVTNPATAPVHLFHLGMWFESPAISVAAGCSANTTPFNGDHTAGVQVFNTTNFPDDDGPIGQFGE